MKCNWGRLIGRGEKMRLWCVFVVLYPLFYTYWYQDTTALLNIQSEDFALTPLGYFSPYVMVYNAFKYGYSKVSPAIYTRTDCSHTTLSQKLWDNETLNNWGVKRPRFQGLILRQITRSMLVASRFASVLAYKSTAPSIISCGTVVAAYISSTAGDSLHVYILHFTVAIW